MDPFQGIRVDMISEGHALDLYDDPEADQTNVGETLYTRARYIEAVTGAKFTIRVVVSQLFDLSSLSSGDGIRMMVVLDGLKCDYYNIFRQRDMNDQIRENGEALFDIERIMRYCKASKRWTNGEIVFSAAETDDSNETQVVPKHIMKLGSIEVIINRIRLVTRLTPDADWEPNNNDEPITTVSEKMVKGKAITNLTKLQNVSASPGPASSHDMFHIAGNAGKELHFDFRYRSRQTLQSLGCIPRTPSPEPDLREENRALRERLAQLERNSNAANVKRESARAATTAGVKREREEADDRRERKRRGNVTYEVVDLTED